METPPLSSFSGSIWSDSNANGIKDAEEENLENITVFIDENNNASLDADEATAITDAFGNYQFENILVGLYNVRVDISEEISITLPDADTSHIPFTALEENNQGLVGTNTIENFGHAVVVNDEFSFGNAYYSLASPDFDNINPASSGAIQGQDSVIGFSNTTEALANNSLSAENLVAKLGQLNLGDDIEGEDWFLVGNREIRYYTGDNLTFQINGENLIEASVERFTLVIDYNTENFGEDRIFGWFDISSLEDVSQNSSSESQKISEAIFADVDERDTRIVFDSIQIAGQTDFITNDVVGAFYESNDVNFTFSDTNFAVDSGYQIIVESEENLTGIDFGLLSASSETEAEENPLIVSTRIADIILDENSDSHTINLSNLFEDADGDEITISVQSNSNSQLVSASIEGNNLTLDVVDGESGTAEITIQGTVNDETIDDTFSVTVEPEQTDSDTATELEPIELFRFRNTTFDTGTYVFVEEQERDDILANSDLNQTFELEGSAFIASNNPLEESIPFFRLASLDVQGTFLFVGEEEYNAIFAEGSAFADSFERQGFDEEGNDIPEFYLLSPGSGGGELFTRYQNLNNGTYLYAGQEETIAIDNNPNFASIFTKEGSAFESLV